MDAERAPRFGPEILHWRDLKADEVVDMASMENSVHDSLSGLKNDPKVYVFSRPTIPRQASDGRVLHDQFEEFSQCWLDMKATQKGMVARQYLDGRVTSSWLRAQVDFGNGTDGERHDIDEIANLASKSMWRKDIFRLAYHGKGVYRILNTNKSREAITAISLARGLNLGQARQFTNMTNPTIEINAYYYNERPLSSS